MQGKHYKAHKDRFSRARGGSSAFLNIACAQCNTDVLLYQKDGPGPLLRMYLDRIHAPVELVTAVSSYAEKSATPALTCPSCKTLLAVPMVYEPEDRLAYRVIDGTLRKTKGSADWIPEKV